MTPVWRFIRYSNHDGATNMATDEAILEARIAKQAPPTLRLYGFAPPAVTIGLSQKMTTEVMESIQRSGFDVIRRPTGGRAVLHLDDLTYSFVGTDVTDEGFLSAGINESYKQISAGLTNAFWNLGVSAEMGVSGTPYKHLQDCFMATTGCDLQHGGTKLIGSAQTRRRGSVLQHGSVPLKQDPGLMSRLLGEPQQDSRHVNLFDIAGRELSFDELEAAFRKGFEDLFGIQLADGELTEFEQTIVSERKSNYASPVPV